MGLTYSSAIGIAAVLKWHVKCGLVIEKWKVLTTFTRLGPKCPARDRAKRGNKVEE